jgi:Fic family protein
LGALLPGVSRELGARIDHSRRSPVETREEYHRKLRSAWSSGLLGKLVDALFERPSIHIAAAAKLLELTPASASANVKKLVEAGILIEVTGRKRDQLFVAREILAVADGS